MLPKIHKILTFGYFIFKNFAVGLNAQIKYERIYDAVSPLAQFTDATSLEYTINPFFRYYFPLKSRFGFYTQLHGSYSHLSPKDYFAPPPTDIAVGLSVGAYYFLNNSVSLEAAITDKINDRSYGDLIFNDAKRTNTLNFSIGVQCYLNKKVNIEEQTVAPKLARGTQMLGGILDFDLASNNQAKYFSAQPSYGYFVLKNFAAEVNAFYQTTSYNATSGNYQDVQYGASLSVSYFQKLFGRWYIVPRVGVESSHYENKSDPNFVVSTRHAFIGALNLNYFISNSFALELGINHKYEIVDKPIISPEKLGRFNDTHGFIGFRYFLLRR